MWVWGASPECIFTVFEHTNRAHKELTRLVCNAKMYAWAQRDVSSLKKPKRNCILYNPYNGTSGRPPPHAPSHTHTATHITTNPHTHAHTHTRIHTRTHTHRHTTTYTQTHAQHKHTPEQHHRFNTQRCNQTRCATSTCDHTHSTSAHTHTFRRARARPHIHTHTQHAEALELANAQITMLVHKGMCHP